MPEPRGQEGPEDLERHHWLIATSVGQRFERAENTSECALQSTNLDSNVDLVEVEGQPAARSSARQQFASNKRFSQNIPICKSLLFPEPPAPMTLRSGKGASGYVSGFLALNDHQRPANLHRPLTAQQRRQRRMSGDTRSHEVRKLLVQLTKKN